MTIMLNGSDLTVTEVVAAARHGETVALDPGAVETMEQARAVVEEVLAKDEPVYGLTTGVGERKSFLLDPAERRKFNQRLVLNHRIAQGDAAPADVVRGAMVLPGQQLRQGRDRRPARAGRDDRHPAQRGLRAAGPVGSARWPGRPRPDGRSGRRAHHPQRLRGGRERRAWPWSAATPSPPPGPAWPWPTRRP